MQERRKPTLDELKMDRFIGHIYHYMMVAEAAISSGAVVASIPLIYFNVLPTWADIAIVASGGLIAPTSVHETKTTKKWLEQAKKAVNDHEDHLQNSV